MKHIIVFMLMACLFSVSYSDSKGFFDTMKKIRYINYEIKATGLLLEDKVFPDKNSLEKNLVYTRKCRWQLIKDLLPGFKNREPLDFITELEHEEYKECLPELTDILLEYYFNNNSPYRNEIIQRIAALKDECETYATQPLRDYSQDIQTAYEAFNARDYAKAITYFNRALPELDAMASNPALPPYIAISMQIQVKTTYQMLGISYVYVTPPQKEQFYYNEARAAFFNAINKYPGVYQVILPASYSYISRTYYYEKNADKALLYLDKYSEANQQVNGEPVANYEHILAEILMLDPANYDIALQKIEKAIASYTPDSDFPPIEGQALYYHRAFLYAAKGRFSEAQDDIAKSHEYYDTSNSHNDEAIFKDERDYYLRKLEALESKVFVRVFPNPLAVKIGLSGSLVATAATITGEPVDITADFQVADSTVLEQLETKRGGNYSWAIFEGKKPGETTVTVNVSTPSGTETATVPAIVEFDPAIFAGFRDTFPMAGPVNLFTGNISLPRTDYGIPKQGLPLAFSRNYNSVLSKDTAHSTMGKGWVPAYNWRLDVTQNDSGVVYLHTNTGAIYNYLMNWETHVFDQTQNKDFPLLKRDASGYQLFSKDETVFKFALSGELTEISASGKDILKFKYIDATVNGAPTKLLTTVTDRFSRKVTIQYDSSSYITQVNFDNGFQIKYEYANGLLTKALYPMTLSEQYVYNKNNLLEKVIYPDSSFSLLVYDSEGKLIGMTDPEGNTEGFEYKTGSTVITDALLNKTTATFDYKGRAQRYDAPLNTSTQYGWNNNNDITSLKDPKQNSFSLSYDSAHNMTGFSDPMGNMFAMTYDSRFNYLTSAKDPLGRMNTSSYDSYGRIISATSPTKDKTTFSYGNDDLFDYVTSLKESDDVAVNIEYDSYGYTKKITRTKGGVTVFEEMRHDPSGRLTAKIDMKGAETTYMYDALDRVIKVTNPDGTSKRFEYDSRSNIIKTIDEMNYETKYTYDKNRRLTSVTLPDGNITSYKYNISGDLIKVIKADAREISFSYDALHRLTAKTDEAGFTTRYEYDSNSNVTKITKPAGNFTEFVYDSLNRATEKRFFAKGADKPEYSITYKYDSVGNLIEVESPNTTVKYTLNDLNQITKEEIAGSLTSEFTYDAKGKVLSEKSDYQEKQFTYDSIERITKMTADGRDYSYNYDQYGRVSSFTRGGITENFEFDIMNRVIGKKTAANGIYLENIEYRRDNTGRLTYKKEELENKPDTFTYDGVGRLTNATYEDGNYEEFTYNSIGERNTYKAYTHPEVNYTYSPDGRLLNTDDGKFYYDNNGNLTKKEITRNEDGKAIVDTTIFEYNARDLLAKITLPDGKIAEFEYDAFGRRIKVTYDGVSRKIIYSGDNKVAEIENGNTTVFTYGGGIDEALALTRDGKSYDMLRGATNSVSKIVDKNSTVKEYKYRAFGNIYGDTADFNNDVTYTGREFDSFSGLYFYRSRYYDPSVGRFMGKDSYPPNIMNPMSFNPYMYCSNDPVNHIDPMGLSWFKNFVKKTWSKNRVSGIFTAMGGVFEVGAGASLTVATGGLGAVFGAATALHGLDTMQAGLRQIWYGQEIDTITSNGLQSIGMSRNAANITDSAIGIVGSLGSAGINIAGKIPKIAIASEEAGMSLWKGIWAWNKGSRAFPEPIYKALGGDFTNPIQKSIMMASGNIPGTDKIYMSVALSGKIISKGLTVVGDFISGVGGAIGQIASEW